jgi:hypothetical protein
MEGYNIADLGFGTASPSQLTISFWVNSALAGAYTGAIVDSTGGRSYPFAYTINATNTWEQKTVTLTADTSGTWGSTNGTGLYLEWSLMCGSTYQGTANTWQSANYRGTSAQVNWMATSGNTFYVTGVQLEKGSTATSFDYRPYGTELALCQRYCPVWESTATNSPFAVGQVYSSTNGQIPLPYPVAPRVPATGITTVGTFNILNSTAGAITASITFNNASFTTLNVIGATAGGVTAGYSTLLTAASSSSKIIGNGCEL